MKVAMRAAVIVDYAQLGREIHCFKVVTNSQTVVLERGLKQTYFIEKSAGFLDGRGVEWKMFMLGVLNQ